MFHTVVWSNTVLEYFLFYDYCTVLYSDVCIFNIVPKCSATESVAATYWILFTIFSFWRPRSPSRLLFQHCLCDAFILYLVYALTLLIIQFIVIDRMQHKNICITDMHSHLPIISYSRLFGNYNYCIICKRCIFYYCKH